MQLLHVQQALQSNPTGQNRKDLLSLESNIKELLQLTKESTSDSNGAIKSTNCAEKASSSMDDEYALFMVIISFFISFSKDLIKKNSNSLIKQSEMANLEEPTNKEAAENDAEVCISITIKNCVFKLIIFWNTSG